MIASSNFSKEKVESIIEFTDIFPDASASIAGLNNPHLEPINVISFMMVGVKSRFYRDAIVDFRTTIPRGLTSFIVSVNPELLPVASTTKSNNCSSVDSIPNFILIPD